MTYGHVTQTVVIWLDYLPSSKTLSRLLLKNNVEYCILIGLLKDLSDWQRLFLLSCHLENPEFNPNYLMYHLNSTTFITLVRDQSTAQQNYVVYKTRMADNFQRKCTLVMTKRKYNDNQHDDKPETRRIPLPIEIRTFGVNKMLLKLTCTHARAWLPYNKDNK